MQAVEERDQVEGPRIVLGGGALESGAVGDTRLARQFAGAVDRRLMIIKAEKLRFRKRLRHQDYRRAVAASDVRDARAAFEFLADAVERGNPFGYQMHRIAGGKEA